MDSNYQASYTGGYSLNDQDLAFQSRQTNHITLDFLSKEEEIMVLSEMANGHINQEEIALLVEFAHKIRASKLSGEFRTVPMPTFRQYSKVLQRAALGRGFNLEKEVPRRFYGTASPEDYNKAEAAKAQIFNTIYQQSEDVEDLIY